MNTNTKKDKKIVFLAVLILLAIIICAYIYFTESSTLKKSLSHVNGNPLTFNYESGFYNHELEIIISKDIELPLGAEIYYTLNGDDPTNESTKYIDSIELKTGTKTRIYPVKAIVFYNNEYSEIYQETYIIDKNVESRFTLPVISITSDRYNLYNYDYGIMVSGAVYDANKDKNEALSAFKIGNYTMRGDKWIRTAKLTIFEPNGNILINKDIGLALSGKSSAAYGKEKSFKLISNYNNDSKFDINFSKYGNLDTTKKSNIYNYNTLKLKSTFQDKQFGNITAMFSSRIIDESNFDGNLQSLRTIVYLNGKFYGLHTMQETFSNSTLAKKFNIDNNDDIEKYKGKEKIFWVDKLDNYQSIIDVNLSFENQKSYLEKNFDIDNMLLYYAINILTNNYDWPNNNYELWRYTGKYDSNNKYTDGKWRFLIFDMDMIYPTSLEYNKAAILLNDSTFLSNLLSIPEYKDKFVTIISDLTNTSFSLDNIYKISDEEYNKIKVERNLQYSKEENSSLDKSFLQAKERIKHYNANLINTLEEKYNLSEKYTFNLKVNDGIKAYWNNMEFYGNSDKTSYSNQYYKGVNFKINFEEYPGYKFDYWLVNGKKYYNKELEIKDELIENDKINIEIVTKRDNDKSLIISEINAKDDSDWIKLLNIGQNSINIGNYYITDNKNKPLKSQLPDIELKPNESIILNGNKNYYAVGDYICNFNLSVNETLYLYNSEKNIIEDSVVIPRMSSIETYGRYLNSNTFMFFDNENNRRKLSTY